ncbi:MAG: amidase family protein [Dongiaceae bacterium]
MTFSEYGNYDAYGLAALVRQKAISPIELLDAALAQGEKVNPQLNALCHLVPDRARAAIAAGLPDGAFTGVPFLLKDLGAEAVGFPTNSGSRLFANYDWTYDSEIFIRLRATGLVTFGRTTSPELGVGPVTEAAVYGGPTRNPWNPAHTSGGSSGGAAAAVAAGIVPIAHGSDGGGSVRIPAACCGLVGLKPTRARLPDGPASGEGWGGMSIDGVLTRSVRDTAAALDATQGPDLGAPYWAPPIAGKYLDAIGTPPKRLVIAICTTNFEGRPIHAECRQAVENTAKLCADLGHDIVEARPDFDFLAAMRAWSNVVAVGTALSVQAKADAMGRPPRRDEIEPIIYSAWEHGLRITGPTYLQGINTVHATGRRIAAFFEEHDMLLTPVLTEPPAAVGRFAPTNPDFFEHRLGRDGLIHYSPFAPIFNITGQPAISLPLHWTADGLPVGLHFAGRFGDEKSLLQLAAQLEKARPWFDRRPPIS